MPLRSSLKQSSFDFSKYGESVNPFAQKLAKKVAEKKVYFDHIDALKSELKFMQQYRRTFIEIGCHYGYTLSELAKINPQDYFLGFDITFKRVVKTSDRVGEHPNAKVIYANAKDVPELFEPGSLDGVIIFFPDPWVKKTRAPHRLLTQDFCEKLKILMKPQGFIWFKCDDSSYSESVKDYFLHSGFRLKEGPPLALTPQDISSSFQKLFESQGKNFCNWVFHRDQLQ